MRTICIPIVDGAKGVEALLSSSVPDGKIDGGGIYVQTKNGRTLHCTLLFVAEHVVDVAAQRVTMKQREQMPEARGDS